MTKKNLPGALVFLRLGNISLLQKKLEDENSLIFYSRFNPTKFNIRHVFYYMQNYGPNPGK